MSTTNPLSTATTSSTPPLPTTQQHEQQQQQHVYPNIRPPTTPNPSQGFLYPVASSARGFIPKPLCSNSNTSDHNVPVANNASYPPRPNHLPYHHHLVRPPFTNQHHIPPPIRGIPVSSPHPKVASSSSPMAESNGYKNSRDKKDETVDVIRDRKVRISEGASLYAHCRSWLKNGFPEESQLQYGDVVKSLPRPLPILVDANMAQKIEGDEEEEKENDKEEVAHLSEKELLKRHVKHAKKVRAWLREVRAKRIERYKTRLSLLLPPPVEQSRNDGAAGN